MSIAITAFEARPIVVEDWRATCACAGRLRKWSNLTRCGFYRCWSSFPNLLLTLLAPKRGRRISARSQRSLAVFERNKE